MKSIILASHGELSQGMKHTVSMILGTDHNVYALSAFRDEDESISQQLERLISQIGTEDVYILTDILGGSVNNDMLLALQKYPELNLITGMNLPLVIAVATHPGPIPMERLNEMIRESQESLVNCRSLLDQSTMIGGNDL